MVRKSNCITKKTGPCDVGNIGEAMVLYKFIELGIPVYMPFGDHSPVDMVVDIGNKLYKVQVKTTSVSRNGKTKFYLTTNTYTKDKNKIGKKVYKYTKEEIDFFVLCSIDRKKIYMVRVEKPLTGISIRHEESISGQVVGVNYEKDYLIENVLSKMIN